MKNGLIVAVKLIPRIVTAGCASYAISRLLEDKVEEIIDDRGVANAAIVGVGQFCVSTAAGALVADICCRPFGL